MYDFFDALDGARFVRVFLPEGDGELALVYVWHGGHTVNVHRVLPGSAMLEIDAFSAGSYANDAATLDEVKSGIDEHFRAEVQEIGQ